MMPKHRMDASLRIFILLCDIRDAKWDSTVSQKERQLRWALKDNPNRKIWVDRVEVSPLHAGVGMHLPTSTLKILYDAKPSEIEDLDRFDDVPLLHPRLYHETDVNTAQMLETIQFLVTKFPKARLMRHSRLHTTPIHFILNRAFPEEEFETVKIIMTGLIDGSEDVLLLPNYWGETPWDLCRRKGNGRMLREVLYPKIWRYCKKLKEIGDDSSKIKLRKFFVMILDMQHLECVQAFWKDVNLTPQYDFGDGYTPLHVLCAKFPSMKFGDGNMIPYLMLLWMSQLDFSVASFQATANKSTPLHLLIQGMMNQKYDDDTSRTKIEATCLQWINQIEGSSFLIKRNKDGLTPSMLAATSQLVSIDFLFLLLSATLRLFLPSQPSTFNSGYCSL